MTLTSVPYATRVATVEGAEATFGANNTNTGLQAFVAGENNIASGDYSTVSGGEGNVAGMDVKDGKADGAYSTVGGGRDNRAGGDYSTVPGGRANVADGDYSFAAGFRAMAIHDGSYVWADGQNMVLSSSGPNQYIVRAAGGVGINTSNPQAALHIGGTPGVDGLMFPDGTLQTTAGGGGGSGDITGVNAGAGLTGGGTSGDVTLSADFSGNGSASTVSRSDHGHDAAYVNEGQPNSVTGSMINSGTIDFNDVGQNGAAVDQVMKWNGSAWVADDDETGAGGGGDITAVNAGSGLDGGGESGDVTLSLEPNGVNSSHIQNASIQFNDMAQNGAASGQIMKWNGSTWVADDDDDDAGSGSETDPEVGSNTTNFVPKWDGLALVTGTIYDNGNIGIGTSGPAAKLDVNGAIAVSGSVVINSSGAWVGDPTGLIGPAPGHDWAGTQLRFQNSDGSWGTWVDLEGPQGIQGIQGIQGPEGPTGPAVTTFAICLDSNNGDVCSCPGATLLTSMPGACTVTSDTGTCTAPQPGQGGAHKCCVCMP